MMFMGFEQGLQIVTGKVKVTGVLFVLKLFGHSTRNLKSVMTR